MRAAGLALLFAFKTAHASVQAPNKFVMPYYNRCGNGPVWRIRSAYAGMSVGGNEVVSNRLRALTARGMFEDATFACLSGQGNIDRQSNKVRTSAWAGEKDNAQEELDDMFPNQSLLCRGPCGCCQA